MKGNSNYLQEVLFQNRWVHPTVYEPPPLDSNKRFVIHARTNPGIFPETVHEGNIEHTGNTQPMLALR